MKTAVPAGFVTGMNSGILSGVKEQKGEKDPAWAKALGYTPLLLTGNTMISEIAASKKGLKALKKAGASEEYLKVARKSLKAAGGTYAGALAAGTGTIVAGRVVGKHIGRKIKLENKKKQQQQ